jgi:hypothetical protein
LSLIGEVSSAEFPILIEGGEPRVSVALTEECVDPVGSKREPSQLSGAGCAKAELIENGKKASTETDFVAIPQTPNT